MPNDNTHTDLSGGPCQTPVEDLRKRALEHYEEASMAISHWNSDVPKAINEYYDRLALSRTPAEPKAGDWEKELRSKRWTLGDTNAKVVLLDDAIDVLRRAISSAANQPKAGDWGLRTWLEGQISILDRMLGESTSHSEQMNIGFARKAYEDVLIRMKPVENDPLHNEGWDADFFIASEVMPHVSKVKGTIYIEDATHFIKEAVRRALSSAAPRITDVGSLQRYRLGLRVVDGIAEAPILEEDPNGSLVAFNHVLDLIAPAPLPGITAERIKSALDKAWRETMDGEPADFYRALWIRIKRELRLAMSPAPLSGITEEMVERVIHDFVDPIASSLDPTAYDDGAEYAALEIKDRLIALLHQQGAERKWISVDECDWPDGEWVEVAYWEKDRWIIHGLSCVLSSWKDRPDSKRFICRKTRDDNFPPPPFTPTQTEE